MVEEEVEGGENVTGGEGEMVVVVEELVGLSTVIGPWCLQRVGVVSNIAA